MLLVKLADDVGVLDRVHDAETAYL